MKKIFAIDIHGHYGISTDQKFMLTNKFMSADASEVVRRARRAGIALTVVSPLSGLMIRPSPQDVEDANKAAMRTVESLSGLRLWAILDPRNSRCFDQVADMLTHERCVGIKIYPGIHRFSIRSYGKKIFEFAERHEAILVSHTGQPCSWPADFVPFANAFPGVRLVLCHLGFGIDGDITHQVRAVQKSRHGNVFVDTSSSNSIIPNLIEWAVKKIGSHNILFGTDTPLYFAANQRARIDYAEISASDKSRILRTNALKLLNLKEKSV